MLKEFKECAMGGSMVDMAVGVVSAIPAKALCCPRCTSALDKG